MMNKEAPFDLRPTSIALIQHASEHDIEKNRAKAIALIHEAVRKGADIICLQELLESDYFPGNPRTEDFDASLFSQTIPGPLTEELMPIAKKHGVVIVGGSVYEKGTGKDDGKFYNSAPIIDADGSLLAIHRKAHLPNDPGYCEEAYFSKGDKAITVVDTKKGKMAVGICFDQWFPEAAMKASRQGAELLLYPTAIGHTDEEWLKNIPGDIGNWDKKLRNALKGQAAAGSMFVGMANRVGREDPTTFFGQSALFDTNGETLAIASDTRDEVIMALCNLGIVKETNDAWVLHKSRRPDLYS